MVGSYDDLDEFGFGEEPPAKQGVKRDFDDFLEDDEELYPTKKTALADDHATTTILNLRASLDARDQTISKLQSKLTTANLELDAWRNAFQNSNLLNSPKAEPLAVLEAVEMLQGLNKKLKEEMQRTKKRENTILLKMMDEQQQISDLQMEVKELQQSQHPSTLQGRRLLLDPAIHSEFSYLKKQAEAAEQKVVALQEEVSAMQFTPTSKHGKMLMAKCKTLQEENEEMGQMAAEGKVHEVENKLALQKQLNGELKKGYQELQEDVGDMNEEAERLQSTVVSLQRQLQAKDAEISKLVADRKHGKGSEEREKSKSRKVHKVEGPRP